MDINFVTIGLILLFFIPIITGALRPFTRERIYYSFESIFDNLKLIVLLVLSIYLTKIIYFEHGNGVFLGIYQLIPESFKNLFIGKDILAYVFNVPILLSFFLLLSIPVKEIIFRYIIAPIAEGVYNLIQPLNNGFKAFLGGAVQIPRSALLILITGLLLNFFNYYYQDPQLTKWMQDSTAYNYIYDKGLTPILDSGIAKKIPVLLNDSFGKNPDNNSNDGFDSSGRKGSVKDLVNKIAGKNVKVIEYFNGVTLDEAIKSNKQIDDTAKNLVKGENDDYNKAKKIYKWVTKNISYDYKKAEMVSNNPSGIQSGSIEAFTTGKGICFDYSCLYISMCRAVGIKVRMITGLGYSGVAWGDHAWNEAFSASKNKWINVDTTFGTMANYFDRANFNTDHKGAEIQGEW
ncbi:MAG: transglutaminase-like domain-containing protein [Bacillota bacterium]|nr:transglutaminase-like domain-containing protein [Bacillota bacterium]